MGSDHRSPGEASEGGGGATLTKDRRGRNSDGRGCWACLSRILAIILEAESVDNDKDRYGHRLLGSIGDLQDIVRALRSKGVNLRAVEQPIDTGTSAGKAFLDMLGVFAEFETNLRKERQLEGIAKAKADGVYKGRKPTIDVARVRALQADGLGATEIAERLKIGRASVYRVLGSANVTTQAGA